MLKKAMTAETLYEVVITAIVVNEGKFLIMKRAATKKRFPNRWTVPGGHLELTDFTNSPKETADYWYNVLEKALRREVKEECGVEIQNIEYVTSLATVHSDGSPSLVISCMADYKSGEITLQTEETDEYAWASLEEAKEYDLIDGIYDELLMADKKLKGEKSEWQRG